MKRLGFFINYTTDFQFNNYDNNCYITNATRWSTDFQFDNYDNNCYITNATVGVRSQLLWTVALIDGLNPVPDSNTFFFSLHRRGLCFLWIDPFLENTQFLLSFCSVKKIRRAIDYYLQCIVTMHWGSDFSSSTV